MLVSTPKKISVIFQPPNSVFREILLTPLLGSDHHGDLHSDTVLMFVKVSDPGWNVFVKTFLTIKNEIYTIIIIIIHTNMTSFPPSNIIIIHTHNTAAALIHLKICTKRTLHANNTLLKRAFSSIRI